MTQIIQSQIEKKKQHKLYNLTDKLRESGLKSAPDFLENKAKKSKSTALAYASGIKYLDRFAQAKYGLNADTILSPLINKQIDVYDFINDFSTYLVKDTKNGENLNHRTIDSYVTGVRSYFVAKDVDISIAKWKGKVTLPPIYNEEEQAIDAQDIRNLLQHCNNRRLKAYLLVLASSGARAMEALTLRESDIDLSGIYNDESNPGIIKIRKEYSKNNSERTIYISNEAARFLHSWIDYVYSDKNNKTKSARKRNPDDLIFSSRAWNWKEHKYPTGLYDSLLEDFQKLLKETGLCERKEDGVFKRRKITFHSFRRFVKTTIANQTRNSDFSEWYLGHIKSPYWVNKPGERMKIYKEDCMKYLTFLSYDTVQNVTQNAEEEVKTLRRENELLRAQVRHIEATSNSDKATLTDSMGSLSDMVMQLKQEVEQLKKKDKG
jgi:integrase